MFIAFFSIFAILFVCFYVMFLVVRERRDRRLADISINGMIVSCSMLLFVSMIYMVIVQA